MNAMIKISPDKEKAKSILKSSEITLERISETNQSKFSSNIVKDYYEVIRELISAILSMEGIKTSGENAHKEQINYFNENYNLLNAEELIFINDLRIIRNKISYEGLQIKRDYLRNNITEINKIIDKLKKMLVLKLGKF